MIDRPPTQGEMRFDYQSTRTYSKFARVPIYFDVARRGTTTDRYRWAADQAPTHRHGQQLHPPPVPIAVVFLRFFYDSPKILNTWITNRYSRIDGAGTVDPPETTGRSGD
ncbi:hypothetical protein [Nocardia xishanensis]